MTKEETRDRLIELIKEHQLDNGLTKLAVGKISEMAGITRQTFYRSYLDLKPFCLGQSITALLGDDVDSTRDFLAKREQDVNALLSEIEAVRKQHKKDLEQAITNRITSLMNSDILAFEASELNTLLLNQSQHNEMLKRKITELELKLTRFQMTSAADELSAGEASDHTAKSAKNVVVFPLDMTKPNLAYKQNKDFEKYEDAKDAAIESIIDTVKKLTDSSNVEIHFFQERYISSFDDFAKGFRAKADNIVVVIQLPVFAQEEFSHLLHQLKRARKISIHIPVNTSKTAAIAKKEFFFREVPDEEFTDSTKAKTPQITWGFDEVIMYRTQ